MSETEIGEREVRKHRHDGPDVSHGPETTAAVTAAVQVVLGLCLVATAALIVFSAVVAF